MAERFGEMRTDCHLDSNSWSCKYKVGASSRCAAEYLIYCATIVCSALSSIAAKCPEPLNTTLDTMDGHREEPGLGRRKLHTQSHIHNKHIHTYAMQTHLQYTCSYMHTHTHMGINHGIHTCSQLLKGTKLA